MTSRKTSNPKVVDMGENTSWNVCPHQVEEISSPDTRKYAIKPENSQTHKNILSIITVLFAMASFIYLVGKDLSDSKHASYENSQKEEIGRLTDERNEARADAVYFRQKADSKSADEGERASQIIINNQRDFDDENESKDRAPSYLVANEQQYDEDIPVRQNYRQDGEVPRRQNNTQDLTLVNENADIGNNIQYVLLAVSENNKNISDCGENWKKKSSTKRLFSKPLKVLGENVGIENKSCSDSSPLSPARYLLVINAEGDFERVYELIKAKLIDSGYSVTSDGIKSINIGSFNSKEEAEHFVESL